jgi:asparagine synthase (glutamine-hydrolysing)
MCGIAGLLVAPGNTPDTSVLRRMTDALAHRGPDDEGIEILGHMGFGHRRLSIIDLTPAGHQPMASSDGKRWITYNGEVYNYPELREELAHMGHSFRTQSDTEVILEAYEEWGPACLDRLNGIFAFAIWEPCTGCVFLARDRLGVKPLYYHWDGRCFAFASEIKALLAVPGVARRVDREALGDYLAFRYVVTNQTMFSGIHRLMPGHCMEIQADALFQTGRLPKSQCWWDPPFVSDFGPAPADLEERLADLLQDAVRMQMRSDVPVGCHLSGGLDSSTIACLAARQTTGVLQTFTGRFLEAGGFDESAYARYVVERTGADATWIDIRYGDLADSIVTAVHALDEPVVGWGVLPQMEVSRVCARRVKVVLGGQGGDELFGGYSWYRQGLLGRFFGTMGLGTAGQGGGITDVMRLVGVQSWRESLSMLRHASPFIESAGWRQARAPGLPADLVPSMIKGNLMEATKARFLVAFNDGNADPLQRMFRFDIKNFLAGLLKVEDRTSMAFSLESRVPLLDHRLVELAARMPVFWKVPNARDKPLLRRVARRFVPAEIVNRTDKQGFPTPLAAWLRDPGNPVHRRLLHRDSLRSSEWINPDALENVVKQHVSGRRDMSGVLWQVANLEAWLREFDVA